MPVPPAGPSKPRAEAPSSGPDPRLRFGRRQRLTLANDFRAALRGEGGRRFSRARGPLVVCARRNHTTPPTARLGLSVSRRVGNAVRRNRLKRLLREAFRLDQRQLPPGIDLVIVVRPHDPRPLAEYRAWLLSAADALRRDLDRNNPP